jgi:hypothetical protein
MTDATADPAEQARVEIGRLVRGELEGKIRAVREYDVIIWKVRAGYLAILYGSLALLLGTAGVPDLKALTGSVARSTAAIAMISGFSLAAFFVDFAYLRQKLKVIVARNELTGLVLAGALRANDKLGLLLRVSGEADVLDEAEFPKAHREYVRQRNWNLKWVSLWLYGTTPVVAAFIYAVARSWPH